VTYVLEPLDGGTRITLRHSGFAAPFVAPGMCMNTCIGWETSFERLAEILAMRRRKTVEVSGAPVNSKTTAIG
jgi:hypothetical protein